jgi:hypothetical protein
VTSEREYYRPASVLWGSVEGSGWGSWSVWVVIIVPLRAHSDVFLLLTAAFACARVCASSGGRRFGSGPDDGGGHLG